jgi:hypothetical protein
MKTQAKFKHIVVPRTASGIWHYTPVQILDSMCDDGIGDYLMVVEDARLYHFGILSSMMHMAWIRFVSGRLESSYRVSSTAAFKNYPWPIHYTQAQMQIIEAKAQEVLNIRAQFADRSLSDLYNPIAMPPALLRAHAELDEAVDRAYGMTTSDSQDSRIRFLLNLHLKITAFLVSHHDDQHIVEDYRHGHMAHLPLMAGNPQAAAPKA